MSRFDEGNLESLDVTTVQDKETLSSDADSSTLPAVDILMSTYNGSRYLEEQIASLQGQTATNWHLLVSDDGSSDDTVALLEQMAKSDGRIRVLQDSEAHRGPCGRFLWMLNHATADYIMFCDQDDVWVPNKVEATLRAMLEAQKKAAKDLPMVAFCDAEVVDDSLQPIAPSFMAYEHFDPTATSFRNLLVCNVAPGCTMLFNRALVDSLVLPPDLSQVVMHDWWLMLTAAALGDVIYVDKALIKYRQHLTNVEGARSFDVLKYLAQMKDVAKAHVRCQRQAAAFADAYEGKIGRDDYETCRAYGTMRTFGPQPVGTIIRYGLWQPGWQRRVGQVVLRLMCPVKE